jgi:hypothetical protein
MKSLFTLIFFSIIFSVSAQNNARVIIDIPTDQKPWNNLEWNRSESQFQFAIVTDRTGGHRPGVFPMGIKKLNLLQPEFVMSVGDLIEGYTEDTARLYAEWKEFKSFIEPLESPFFYLPGNHDITNEVMGEVWDEIFGVSYYHFVYNDVLFLCLNSEDNFRGSGRGTVDDAQYEYIKKALEDNPDVKWTMVFIHQPLWVQEDTKRWKDVEKLLEGRKHNVFAGHYHRYWKTERNKGNYIALATTGGWSPLRGRAYGEFDHVVWVTMTEEGPILANLFLDGIWDEDVVTEELVNLVRNRPFPVRIEPTYIDETNPDRLTTTVRITNDADTKMNVSLTGKSHTDFFYQLEESAISVEPNDVKIVTLTVSNPENKSMKMMEPIKINAAITYEFDNKPDVDFSGEVNYAANFKYGISKQSKTKVDGKLKEWGEDWVNLSGMSGKPFDFDGASDCEVKFSTAYDDENLYIAVDITDEELFVNNEPNNYWDQDALIIAIDPRASSQGDISGRHGSSPFMTYRRTFKEEDQVHRPENLPVSVSSAHTLTSSGIQFEMSIPISYIEEIQGKDWKNFRLGLGYEDVDEDGTESTMHYWFPSWGSNEDIPGSGRIFKK